MYEWGHSQPVPHQPLSRSTPNPAVCVDDCGWRDNPQCVRGICSAVLIMERAQTEHGFQLPSYTVMMLIKTKCRPHSCSVHKLIKAHPWSELSMLNSTGWVLFWDQCCRREHGAHEKGWNTSSRHPSKLFGFVFCSFHNVSLQIPG